MLILVFVSLLELVTAMFLNFSNFQTFWGSWKQEAESGAVKTLNETLSSEQTHTVNLARNLLRI
jgi:hypothetical protein